MGEVLRYRVGIDVGTHSIGVCATEVDVDGSPKSILNAQSIIHDSGIDAEHQKMAETRLAAAGVARRTRRLVARRRKRLGRLDQWIASQGWPLLELEEKDDPYYPWRVRARLAAAKVDSVPELKAMLSVAVRHIARHRGWRSAFSDVRSLLGEHEDSEFLVGLKERVEGETGRRGLEDATPGQTIALLLEHDLTRALRGSDGILQGKLHQCDNAMELRRIWHMQGLDEKQLRDLVFHVFDAKSPRGAAATRAGKDPLPGQTGELRAPKSHSAFERYRITNIVTNLRVRDSGTGGRRRLTVEEVRRVVDYLVNVTPKDEPTWADVSAVLEVDRGNLLGTADLTDDGERASAYPPVMRVPRVVQRAKVKPLQAWWQDADQASRDALIEILTNGPDSVEDSPAMARATEFLAELADEDYAKAQDLDLPAGRAAYSVDSLQRLTTHMLDTGDDLHEARTAVFGVAPEWAPPAPQIGEPVGNPAVDRVLKTVSRVLLALEAEFGVPQRVNIEHVRAAFASEQVSRQIDREQQRRFERNRKVETEILQEGDPDRKVRRSDRLRFQAITRQNGQCLYCGTPISMATSEMDHIVPRRGLGSTNTRENLAAVCIPCNRSKSNIPYARWADETTREGVSTADAIERVRHFNAEPGENGRLHRLFQKSVQQRLSQRSEDPEFDARSMESVAWMATELRHRIEHHFSVAEEAVHVSAYKGQLTAIARKASGFEHRIPYLRIGDGSGKSRLDRRHHAVDAAVVSLMTQSVATTLAEREQVRANEQIRQAEETWRGFVGSTPGNRVLYERWVDSMNDLALLIQQQFDQDRIVVRNDLRLRFENGQVHDSTVKAFTEQDRTKVGAAMTVERIDRAASPALWCALTRHPDFVPATGLPENPRRVISVNGETYEAVDEVRFFGGKAAALRVRGGYADIGGSVHHARVYRVTTKGKSRYFMMRVFTVDLVRNRHGDLFSAPIPPQAISRRMCPPALRTALANGEAEELGWLVVGDQMKLDLTLQTKGAIADFRALFPGLTVWRLDGFFSDTQLRLRPVVLSSEGLDEGTSLEHPNVAKILDRTGWVASLNVVAKDCRPTVIRRDSLGRPRLASSAHLPVTWQM